MSTVRTLTRTDLLLRWMVHHDLPQVLAIEQQVAGLQWSEEDFLTALRSLDTVGQVAELNEQIAGFMIYMIGRPPDVIDMHGLRPCWNLGLRWKPAEEKPPLRIDLLNIAVAPDWQRHGIGQILLDKLAQKIYQRGGLIRGMVPETHLPAQLFLRKAGYKAIRVLREYFGSDAGYLMERC